MKLLLTFVFFLALRLDAYSQELPEYINSANAWNSKSKTSVPLAAEDGSFKGKVNMTNAIPMGSLFAKNKAVVKYTGSKSPSRTPAADTLKIFVRIDPTTNPSGYFKILKATVKGDKREFFAGSYSALNGQAQSSSDFTFTISKMSPGVFCLNVVGPKTGDELMLHIGNQQIAVAKLTLGVD